MIVVGWNVCVPFESSGRGRCGAPERRENNQKRRSHGRRTATTSAHGIWH
jgi:hypothetical protein